MEELVRNDLVTDQVIDILCEPLAGKSPELVAQWLTDLGAPCIQFLDGGFISARINHKDLPSLQKVARVSEKKRHQPMQMAS